MLLRDMRVLIEDSELTIPNFNRDATTSILGFFIINSHFRSWTLRTLHKSDEVAFEIVVTRENMEGSAMKPNTAYTYHQKSNFLMLDKWLQQIEMDVVEGKVDETFVVIVKHPKRRDVGAIRLRFALQLHERKV